MLVNVVFLPANKKVTVEYDTTLLEAIRSAGLWVDAPCGGNGSCGKCLVLVSKGNDYEYTLEEEKILSKEEKSKGIRLACCMKIKREICVILEKVEEQVPQFANIAAIKTLKHKELGLALDIGTTTVEYIILALQDETILARGRFYNPQRKYGADVIARISACIKEESLVSQMRQELILDLTKQLREALKSQGLHLTDIKKTVVVANTTISHLFTGRDPRKLSMAPFQPDYMGGSIQPAIELGLPFSQDATVEILPFIGGHIGADTVGCLASLKMEQLSGWHLMVDIGTNGEMVLKGKDTFMACSTAAGPAFEGASMTYGMCQGSGAIKKVMNGTDGIQFDVEGGVRPVGLSGTGMIDGIATLVKSKIIDTSGYLKEEYSEVDLASGQVGFCLYKDAQGGIYITRQDIRQFQLAKAAIRAGIQMLLQKAKVKVQELSGIWIAGAFGTHLNLDNAMYLGLLPTIEVTRYHQIGNAALSGAIARLKEQVSRDELLSLAQSIEHVELATMVEFNQTFLGNISLKRT